ncbi:OmpA family protein [Flavobacterium branchiophilum]|uniref:OmpA family protein n=1 Tax=Flavobacterium branchiophilum TaxID=55197 RepID=UPI0002F4F75F|nr:OmpA family protein [Flavobacterium branchiophilum]
MAKGVKKIKWVPRENDAKVFPKLSIANKLLAIEPDKFAWFEVSEWEDGTTQQDKRKDITWIRQDKSNYIIGQKTLPSDNFYGVRLTKKLSGPYTYYLEASSTGKPDATKNRGLKYRGHCPEKIVKCGWSKTKGNTDLTNQNDNNHGLAYGEAVYLHMETEGLNGAKLIVEVWNEMFKGDYKIREIYDAEVLDGEVNLKIPNTHLWRSDISMLQENEEFYVKVKTPSGRYITDGNKETEFDKYLNIKNKIVTPKFEVPSNQTPLKIGESGKNHERYEPCKFDAIQIKDTDAEKKPVTVTVFEGGKSNGKALEKVRHPAEKVTKSILFEFDSAVISTEGQKVLNNVLQFLLENQYSDLHLSGYACVIGKEAYNQPLSERRANAVKKVLADGKLDPSRILAKGYGEAYHKDGVTTPKANDNKTGADNIKHKTKTENVNARRVDVSFTFYGHDANTMVYETIAPSVTTKKELEIEIIGFDTKKCFQEKIKQHKQLTRVIDIGQIENDGNDVVQKFEAAKFSVKVYSDLSAFNLFPLQYIWPASTTPNKVYIHTHSCRWYSNPSNATVLIKVYPDIKWELALEFIINASNYKAANMPAGSTFQKHNEKAREVGYKRWQMNETGKVPISIGIGLSAEWNDGKTKRSFTNEFEDRIKIVAKVISGAINILQEAINYVQSAAKTTAIPVGFDIRYPKFTVVGKWYLGRINNLPTLNTVGEVGFGFKPLIGAEVVIDIIGLAIAASSYATTGNPAAARIIGQWRNS